MNKTYKLNNIDVSADQIRQIVKENPEILKEESGGPFVPKKGDSYFIKYPLRECGYIELQYFENLIDEYVSKNTERYRTEEEVKRAVEIDRAILRVRNWIRDNIEGGVWDDPDWSSSSLAKYLIEYSYNENDVSYRNSFCVDVEWNYQSINPIGFFRAEKDGEACISACESDLKIIWGVK